MQTMVFTGRLAADPQISPDFAKAVFRLLEKRGLVIEHLRLPRGHQDIEHRHGKRIVPVAPPECGVRKGSDERPASWIIGMVERAGHDAEDRLGASAIEGPAAEFLEMGDPGHIRRAGRAVEPSSRRAEGRGRKGSLG